MEPEQFTRGKPRKGIALLMTLSITVLLSIGLMKTFENRSLEVAHLENNLDRFQAMTLARSLYRVVLIAVKSKGVKLVRYGISEMALAPIPIGNGFISRLSLEPMDRRFLLNQSRRWDNDPTREIILANIYGQIKREQNKNEYEDATNYEVYPVIGGIIDWTDQDQDLNLDFGGKEDYTFDEIPFYNKNSEFDMLSEVKLVQGFSGLNITETSLNKHFRIFGDEERIDLNLASEEEIIKFLENFKDIDDYNTVYTFREELAQIAKQDEMGPFLPKYSSSLELRNNIWEKELEVQGIELNQKEKRLFTEKAEYFEISFMVEIGRVKVGVNSKVKVKYFKDLNIKSVRIMTLKIG